MAPQTWRLTLRDGAVRDVTATAADIQYAGSLVLRDDAGIVCAYPAGVWHSLTRVSGAPVEGDSPKPGAGSSKRSIDAPRPDGAAPERRQTLHLGAGAKP
jgi:hypothetical protein